MNKCLTIVYGPFCPTLFRLLFLLQFRVVEVSQSRCLAHKSNISLLNRDQLISQDCQATPFLLPPSRGSKGEMRYVGRREMWKKCMYRHSLVPDRKHSLWPLECICQLSVLRDFNSLISKLLTKATFYCHNNTRRPLTPFFPGNITFQTQRLANTLYFGTEPLTLSPLMWRAPQSPNLISTTRFLSCPFHTPPTYLPFIWPLPTPKPTRISSL